jgi:hypothetical protein
MADFDPILQEYQSLRNGGVTPKEVLRRLSKSIQPLPQKSKKALAAAIKAWEGGTLSDSDAPPAPERTTAEVPATHTPSSVKTVSGQPKSVRSLKDSTQGLQRTFCWQCGKPNRSEEAICVHCGAVLRQNTSSASTRQLEGDDNRPEEFTRKHTLLLRLRDANEEIQLRPQESDHEMIIGRADAKGVVEPDVDLTRYKAEELGVSRMHLSMNFDKDNNLLKVVDLSSANGVFINGQRLVAREERVLRDGDQLRLGQLVINVFFQSE